MFARIPIVTGLAAAVAMMGTGLGATASAQPSRLAAAEAVLTAGGFVGAQGTYRATLERRLLDTRSGNGAPKAPVGAGGEISVLIVGRGDVPTGVSAVVLNLTAVSPSANTFLTAYPSGTDRPSTSNLNVVAGKNRANLVTVPVGSDGRLRVYNATGTTHVVADVMGYYYGQAETNDGHQTGSKYFTIDPERLFDSRSDGGALSPGEQLTVSSDFGADAENVAALAMNVTALGGSRPGYLSAGSTYFNGNVPAYSTLNYSTGQVVANMAVGGSGVSGTAVGFTVTNGGSGTVHVLLDLVGIYLYGQSDGLRFRPLAPRRIIDTRSGIGGPAQPIGPGEARQQKAPSTVAGSDTFALVANTTVVRPNASTYVTLYDNDLPRPGVSNVNAAKGEVAANSTFVPLGFDELFRVHNAGGSAPVVIDVFGSFESQNDAFASTLRSQLLSGTPGDSTRPGAASTRVERK